jgi:hypothetical protein
MAVFAAGAVISAALSGHLGTPRALWGVLLAYRILSIVFARLTSLVPALGVFFLLGFAWTTFGVAKSPLMVQVTPRALIGRVSSVLNPAVQLAYTISVALAGFTRW